MTIQRQIITNKNLAACGGTFLVHDFLIFFIPACRQAGPGHPVYPVQKTKMLYNLVNAKDVAWQPLREKQLIGWATVLAPSLAGKGASCYVTKSRETSSNRRGYPGTN